MPDPVIVDPAAPPAPAGGTPTPTNSATPPAPAPAHPPGNGTPAPAPADAPKPIEYKLTIPDGSLLDKTDADGVVAFATKHKLAPEAAQEILTARHALLTEAYAAQKSANDAYIAQYDVTLKADAEFGGANLDATKAAAQRVLQKFDVGGEFLSLLKTTNQESLPPLVRMLARIGKAMGEDKAPQGSGSTTPGAMTFAEALAAPKAS